MERACLAFPCLPDKSDDDIKAIATMFAAHPDEYRESRKRLGITLERAYLQQTPMGKFVLGYSESEKPAGEVLANMATSDLQVDKDFVRLVKEVHGFDLTVPPEGPPPETVAEWVDERVTSRGKGFAFCAPGLPDGESAGRAFGKEAYIDRRDELADSRRLHRISLEVVTMMKTPHGIIYSIYAEGDDPVKSNQEWAASASEYDVWFKNELKKVFAPGIDFDEPVASVEQIFDSLAL